MKSKILQGVNIITGKFKAKIEAQMSLNNVHKGA